MSLSGSIFTKNYCISSSRFYLFPCKIPLYKYQTIFLDSKSKITTVPQITLQDKLIIFIYSCNSNQYLPQPTQVCLKQLGTSQTKSSNSSYYKKTLREKNQKLTEFNSILYPQHSKVSIYGGSFICKETISSVQQFHELSTLLQVYYLHITQRAQPIYIPHNISLH